MNTIVNELMCMVRWDEKKYLNMQRFSEQEQNVLMDNWLTVSPAAH